MRWEELRDVQKIRCSSGAFAALLGSGKAGSPGQVAGDQGVFLSTCRASKMPQKNRFHGTMSRFEGPICRYSHSYKPTWGYSIWWGKDGFSNWDANPRSWAGKGEGVPGLKPWSEAFQLKLQAGPDFG